MLRHPHVTTFLEKYVLTPTQGLFSVISMLVSVLAGSISTFCLNEWVDWNIYINIHN